MLFARFFFVFLYLLKIMRYVDDAAVVYKGKPRFHFAADTLEELHQAAREAGIARCWFHRGARWPHYDVTAEQRQLLIINGALALSSKELVRKLRQEAD